MEQGSFPRTPPSLNDCMQTVIDVAHAHQLRFRETVIGNLVRVHLGQAVLMTVALPSMPDVLRRTPMETLLQLPGPGGNHERATRCVRVARLALVLFSFSPECRREEMSDLVHAGTQAYKLAADAVASHDRWSGEMWWELGTSFHRYGQIIAASHRLLNHPN